MERERAAITLIMASVDIRRARRAHVDMPDVAGLVYAAITAYPPFPTRRKASPQGVSPMAKLFLLGALTLVR